MPRTKISEFSATAADNTDIDSIDIAEGCAPSGINNAIRELMAQLKDFQTGAASDPFNGAVNGTLGATTPAAATVTSLTDSGNLTFTGTGNRIRGDFSNATLSSQVAIQTSTTNGNTRINALPNGTGTVSRFIVNNTSDLNNASTFSIGAESAQAIFSSDKVGTGTYLPITFFTGGSERVRIDTSGNVGIGVTPSAWSLGGPALQLVGGASFVGNTARSYINANCVFNGSNWVRVNANYAVQQINDHTDGAFIWNRAASGSAGSTIGFNESMRIDSSGNLLVGTTSSPSGLTSPRVAAVTGNESAFYGVNNAVDSSYVVTLWNKATSGGRRMMRFNAGSSETEVGTIIFNGSSTVYATSSDYRLKDITGAVTGAEAKDFIMALQPKQGTWKSDGSKFVGFLAHELQAVSPSSVSGTKDAVDKNGNPEYQGIQAASSEVMANLIALIQEQQALIQDLTTRLNTLEGN
jgi:hypothetical protein